MNICNKNQTAQVTTHTEEHQMGLHSTKADSVLTLKNQAWLWIFAIDKHSSLLLDVANIINYLQLYLTTVEK